ncbi:MAG: DUF1311 domain-containing protein [Rhodocyclaceae bacterium]|nr:DUF1311 domain-containing protein [Rhodocyclaceae bacterium]
MDIVNITPKHVVIYIATLCIASHISAETNGFRSTITVRGAQSGGWLASAPKPQPDGAAYFLHGKIEAFGNGANFIAAVSASQENDALAGALRRARGMGASTDYFGVVLPAALRQYYFDHARVGVGFDLVGRYTANTQYTTVSGREKTAPVFEAIYFATWDGSAPAQQQATPATGYTACIESADGNMADMIDCASAEAARQDARLNTAYKAAMTATRDQAGLRARQRQWIKQRNAECSMDANGGQAATLAAYECEARKSAQRADELEAMM